MNDQHKSEGSVALIAGGAAALLVLAGAIGLVIVPVSQAGRLGISPWSAICRAVGLGQPLIPTATTVSAVGAAPSTVVYDGALESRLAHADIARGAQLAAQTCSSCHGEAGVSQDGQFPKLADQSAAAIYKALRDYKSGARVSPIMSAMVGDLSERQMLDVAAYFSSDRAFGGLGRRWPVPDAQIATLVESGDPARGLPSCNACHGRGEGGPTESPVLDGQQDQYLRAQLQAFATGARRDDEYGRMRVIARKLTADEQLRLAEYYQGFGPTVR